VERRFGTAQDRLVKGLRIAGAGTLEEADRYLEEEFLPWWNQHLVVAPDQSQRCASAAPVSGSLYFCFSPQPGMCARAIRG
jgi:hypothetical protein